MSKTKPSKNQKHNLPHNSALTTQSAWTSLRKLTNARIALGLAGESLPTKALLNFQLDHARARDAVHSALDFNQLSTEVKQIAGVKFTPVCLESRASSRDQYLRNPGLGRRLSERSASLWQTTVSSSVVSSTKSKRAEILIALGDGLSASAIQKNGVKLLTALIQQLDKSQKGQINSQIPLLLNARVALGDELAEIADAKIILLLIGERPGLSSAENISIYLTYNARVGTTDESRNCISNIGGPGGLNFDQAAQKAAYLVARALKEKRSGVDLKDES